MRITRRNVVKDEKGCYVVTRHGRRVEDTNYRTEADARKRATLLHEMIKEWDFHNIGSVGIVYTSNPRKVY